jgi:H+/Cl- antiporter ClcA
MKNLMTELSTESRQQSWKTQAYVTGAFAGTLFGLAAAYLYTRAAREDADRGGKLKPIGTGELITLGLAALSLVRQITELGKPPKK